MWHRLLRSKPTFFLFLVHKFNQDNDNYKQTKCIDFTGEFVSIDRLLIVIFELDPALTSIQYSQLKRINLRATPKISSLPTPVKARIKSGPL